jgi:hypothetical protein
VLKGRTYESLSRQSGFSVRYLEDTFHGYLRRLPPPLTLPLPTRDFSYLIYDAVWFGKRFCLLCYRVYGEPYIIYHRLGKTEHSAQIKRDLETIQAQGYIFDGIVSDGQTGFIRAVKSVYPFTPHQICLAHGSREAGLGLGHRPAYPSLQTLKLLVDHLFLIESKEALGWWVSKVKQWHDCERDYLNEYTHDQVTGKWWYKHRNARKTIRVLLKLAKTSFRFLDDPLIPKTTNGIEGIFTNLRIKWQIHRGLKRKRWGHFLQWFIYFRNQQILADRNKKKD